MDEAYKSTGLNDIKRAEKLSYECRHILVVLRLFPIELQLAMSNLYKKTLWGFLSIYLDFKMMLIDEQPNKEVYFDKVLKEIFLLLGDDEKTNIWGVVVTSHTLNRIEILKLLARQCIDATKTNRYEHEQYIRMIWVLHVFFSQCKRAGLKTEADRVLETALKLKQPTGLCKWMCHHFPGFGWKGLTDINVHETLVSEKQPRSFFKQVYQFISKEDTLKYQLDDLGTNGTREEDSTSQCSESISNATGKRNNSSSQKESEATSKKTRTDDESKSDGNVTTEDKSKKTRENEKSNQESEGKSSQDKIVNDSSKKPDSSSKPAKTLGPGRVKPITTSAFLDDDDTVDSNMGEDDNTDNDSDESKQADKENKKKSDVQSEEDVSSVKKDKTGKKKNKRVVNSSDDESMGSKNGAISGVTKRVKKNPVTEKSTKTPSDSETDVDEVKKETKLRVSKSLKRKVDADSDDSDHTIAESDITVDNNGDNVDDELTDRRPGRKTNLRSQPVKKPQSKKLKADSGDTNVTTLIQMVDDEDKQQQSEPEVLKKLPNADEEELERIVEEYMNGPFRCIFEDFENEKLYIGTEPFINLSPVPSIAVDTPKESTLADVLHNNKQKAKAQKAGKNFARRRKICR